MLIILHEYFFLFQLYFPPLVSIFMSIFPQWGQEPPETRSSVSPISWGAPRQQGLSFPLPELTWEPKRCPRGSTERRMAVTNSKWFGLASRSRCWKNHARTACQLSACRDPLPKGILQHPASPPGCNCCLFPSPPFMPFRVKAILITSNFLKCWEGVTKRVLVPPPFPSWFPDGS